jgi:hypothetical protein
MRFPELQNACQITGALQNQEKRRFEGTHLVGGLYGSSGGGLRFV